MIGRKQVQDRIVALVPGVDAADDVTAAHLALITSLNLSDQSITALQAGDFDGLSALRSLSLAKNTLSSLPADIFSGLPALIQLDLGSNQLSSLPDEVFSELSSVSRLNLSYNSLDSLTVNTFSEMSALTGLDLGNNQLSSLPNEVFSGLSALNWLSLSSNQLSSLPDGTFSGLSSLNSLYLGDNTVGLSITVLLEKIGDNQFKATTATGAPFNLVLPVTVTNGSIDGGATTITIPTGSVESEPLTVIRTPGTSDALTAVIGTLPELPTSHFGYSLDKPSSTDNTLHFAVSIPKPTGDPNVNNAPIFTEGSSTTRSVPENTPAGKNIGSPVSATDLDEDVLTYTLSGADAASFGIVSTTGQLQTRGPLDYEKKNTYAVIVTVSDGSARDTISVTIDVTDVEENNAPVFVEGSATERSVAENTPAGKNIGGPVSATDLDEDVLTYSLSGVDAASFGIVSTTGQLQTRDPLDYEEKNTYSVTVNVSDGEGGTDTIGVAINVTDVAENNAPVFVEGTATERSVAENTPAGKNIGGPVTATDLDEDVLTYALSGVDAGSFGIVSATGQLRTRAPLDYEKKNTYSVAVLVSDGNGGTDTIGVAINVTDVAENNAPVFVEGSATERSIPENTPAGRNIGAPVVATDLDEDVLTYALSGVDAGSFGIVSATGQLRTRAPLDYEQRNVYSVAVLVSDGNGGSASIGVAINVTDVDETPTAHAPEFVEGAATERSIPENTPAGENIGAPVTATDEDEEDVLTYSLIGADAASFSIVSTTGQLQTRAPLDYEQKNAYAVIVTVSDGTLTDTISVAINVTDVNENNPPVFAEANTTRSIPENTPAGVHIGEAVSAKDADSDDTLAYTLSGTDAAAFAIDQTTGQLKTKAPLDYETKNAYSVVVMASDGSREATTRVAIRVTDVDESRSPVFAGSRTTRFVKENTPAGQNVGSPVSATDEDDDTLTYTLSGTDAAAFSIVSTSGQLKTKAPLDFETKNAYTVTVTVSDGGRTDAITVVITIIDVDENPVTVDESSQPGTIQSVVSISEIMYGSEPRFTPPQWIEINNAGPEPINMTGWKLIVQNASTENLVDGPLNATIVFEDEFWGEAPRIWPNDFLLIVVDDDVNSGGFMDDQIFSLRWRGGVDISFWDTFMSSDGFLIQLIDQDGNLVDEAGNYDGTTTLWDLPYNFNRGRTRAGHRTSLIRRYVDGVALDGTQVASWITAAEANLTEDQLTYYGDEADISTPGIGIVINEISTQLIEYDVNQDGVVDISDLVVVAGRLGQSGPNAADVNGDGAVNVQDLILVAGALGQAPAAPSLHPADTCDLHCR